MTDDRLREELERRSRRAALGHEWARRELLPVISAAIDTRPQRVPAARAQTVAGLAAAVAILLVLVVALPRLAPGPGDTAAVPTDGSLRVQSAAEFADRFSTGQSNGTTALVDGRIRPYDSEMIPYGNVCEQESEILRPLFPTYDCTLGRLDDVDQSIWVNAPYLATPRSQRPIGAEPGDWSWQASEPPIEGRLVLSVSSAGVVEYLGTVLPSNSEPTSVDEANEIGIASLSARDVLLVEGWLWRPETSARLSSIDCSGPDQSPLAGLPNSYCQVRDSLLSVRPMAGEVIGPPGARLSVQPGAERAFGPSDDQAHVFAIAPRLYGGGCTGQTPCWQWEVVARLTDTAIREPSATNVNTLTCGPEPTALATLQIALGRPTLIDETGRVESCEVVDSTAPSDMGLLVTNPDGNESVLEVQWSGTPCDLATTFKFSNAGTGYRLEGRRPDVGCDEPLWRHAMQVHLRRPVAADTVVADLRPSGVPFATSRPTEPVATPAPSDPGPTPQPGTRLSCGPTQPPDPHANMPSATWTGFALGDQTGLVERCEAWEFQPGDASRMTVTNPNGDSRVVELTWAEACASYVNITFNELLSGFEIVPTSTMPDNSSCDGVVHSRGLRLYLKQPVAAETVSTRVIYTLAVTATPPATPQIAPGSGWWELAATERPTAASSELDLLVYERECANGESPEGRVVGPYVEYGDVSVTITFEVSPLPGAGDCPAAPGAPVTVQLSEPLGDRRLVDGGFASSDRVIKHGDGLLWVSPTRSLEVARARMAALLGPHACPQTLFNPLLIDEAELEQMANDLGEPDGILGDGRAWVGDAESAVRELGGFELYQDLDRSWYMIGFAEEQAWLADGIEPGDLVLADVTSLPISGGRTIWIVGRYHQTFGSPDCAWDSDATSALGPRADQQDLGFTVSITAPSASWTFGQSPEGFGAKLEYSGPQDPIVIVGSGSGIAFAYWTRLDGAPSRPPLAVTADCKEYQMASGDTRIVPIYPAPGFSHNGQLTLPLGVWRLTAFTGFTIGECGGQEVGMSASIIVRVR